MKEAAATVEQIRTRVKTDRPELLWAQCYRAVGDLAGPTSATSEALRRWPDDLAVRGRGDRLLRADRPQAEAEASLRYLRSATRRSAGRRGSWPSLAGHAGDRAAWDEALALIGPTAGPTTSPTTCSPGRPSTPRGPSRAPPAGVEILEGLLAELPAGGRRTSCWPGSCSPRARRRGPGRTPRGPPATRRHARGDPALRRHPARAGDLDEAERQLDRLAKVDPDGLPVVELSARILAARGKAEEAAACLEKAFADRTTRRRAWPSARR